MVFSKIKHDENFKIQYSLYTHDSPDYEET